MEDELRIKILNKIEEAVRNELEIEKQRKILRKNMIEIKK